MENRKFETKNVYTEEDTQLLIDMSKWLKQVTGLNESKPLALDMLGVPNVELVLKKAAKDIPGKLIIDKMDQVSLSALLYVVNVYIRISKSLPPVAPKEKVTLANDLKNRLAEDMEAQEKILRG